MYQLLVLEHSILIAYQSCEVEHFNELKQSFKSIYYIGEYIIGIFDYEDLQDAICIALKV